ncbi:MAG: hypothetical protein WC139_07180 [Candidatus Kapaibacterium sp.]
MYCDVKELDHYLLTIPEAVAMFRMSRPKFIQQYITSGKIMLTVLEDGRKMILHAELKKYLGMQQRVYTNERVQL